MAVFYFDFTLKTKNSNNVEIIVVDSQDGSVTTGAQPGNSIVFYATKILDVRWAARRNMNFLRHKGIPALYFEAYYDGMESLDDATGSVVNAGVQSEQYFRDDTRIDEVNTRIGYLPPKLIRVAQPNYINETMTDERGNIYTEQAELTLPAIGLFKKWDKFKIANHQWIVIDNPKSIYDNKGEAIEGFKVKCVALQTGEIDY